MDGAAKNTGSKSGYTLKKHHIFLLLMLLLTIGIYVVPQADMLGYPLLLLATFVHDLARGLVGILGGLHFNSLSLGVDGLATLSMTGSISGNHEALMSAAALTMPLLFAVFLYLASVKAPLAKIALSLIGVALVMAEFLVLDGLFTKVFAGFLAALCLLFAQFSKPLWPQTFLAFLGMELNLSIFARPEYLFHENAVGLYDTASDVSKIAQALFFPYWFWAGLVTVIAAAVLVFGMLLFMRKT